MSFIRYDWQLFWSPSTTNRYFSEPTGTLTQSWKIDSSSVTGDDPGFLLPRSQIHFEEEKPFFIEGSGSLNKYINNKLTILSVQKNYPRCDEYNSVMGCFSDCDAYIDERGHRETRNIRARITDQRWHSLIRIYLRRDKQMVAYVTYSLQAWPWRLCSTVKLPQILLELLASTRNSDLINREEIFFYSSVTRYYTFHVARSSLSTVYTP